MEKVETEELRNFLLKHLREERKLSERSVNYYNSVIRFMYEVTLDKIINKKQEKNAFFFTYQPKSIARICRGVIL